ncbi:MAG: PhoH family protein [Acidimicrobiales bacterium]|nr:PhoH family protein [Acidimicrobiales bacterium]
MSERSSLLSSPATAETSTIEDADVTTEVATRVVLDTSVLIADPESLLAFRDADAVIPLIVVEELDRHKTRLDDVGRAAREVIRTLEELRVANGGDIRHAVALPGGGTLRIETNGLLLDELASKGLDPHSPDNRILAAALGQRRGGRTVLVSNDAALRIKAAQVGLEAAEHHRRRSTPEGHHRLGWTTLEVSPELIDDLYGSPHGLLVEGLAPTDVEQCSPLGANEFAVCRAGSQSVLVRHVDGLLVPVPRHLEAWGLRPRSKEQQFALDLLLDPEVRVIALDGMAGTGKTILALAAGLEQVMESRSYDKLSVYRPVVPVGKAELGFLPGGLDEKLDPWMTAVTDALVALTETRSHADARVLVEEMTARDKLSLEAVTYLRGRSLQGTFVVVDEAQNLEPTTLKTILTRVGEGTKVVFTGDTSQIDAPYLSERNNAIAVLIDAFGGENCFGHIRLTHCERSEVASLAAVKL